MKLWIGLAIPLGLILSLSGGDGQPPQKTAAARQAAKASAADLTSQVDALLLAHWEETKTRPAEEVDDLTLARRLWIDLLGTIPSLQEVRAIQALPAAGRRDALVDRVLDDPRFAGQLAMRLARIAVGTDTNPDDLIYRERRLLVWLTAQVQRDRPWDELVRAFVTAEGLSTDAPTTNFIYSQKSDPTKLAAQTARAFLGLRIDCAQCHDHPFKRWKQDDFEGLAAWYARARGDLGGIRERDAGELEFLLPDEAQELMGGPLPGDHPTPVAKDDKLVRAKFGQPVLAHPDKDKGKPKRQVAPAVPFGQEYLPTDAPNRRAALAAWLTHPKNPYFAKAFVNRLVHWLWGRGLVEPLDELDQKARHPGLLALLTRDFVEHGYDIRRTIRALISSRFYRLSTATAEGVDELEAEEQFAVLPLKRLRGDQLGAAILQVGSLWTYDRTRNALLRFGVWNEAREFRKRNGDDLDLELPEEETLLQRLQLLNGKHVNEVTKDSEDMLPATKLQGLARNDEQAIETAFLITLTRLPSEVERAHFLPLLAAHKDVKPKKKRERARKRVMTDLVWSLLNTTEFAWIR